MELGNDRPGPNGERDDDAPARAGTRSRPTTRTSRPDRGSLEELAQQLETARPLDDDPGGKITEDTFQELLGRSRQATRSSTAATRTSTTRKRRYAEAAAKGIHFVRRRRLGRDLGARGRLLPDGRRRRRAGLASRADLRDAAPKTATRTSGPSGAGHFVKMVHNGIEYGLWQA
jgi:6-phosphogluconate dehydrogenase